MSSTPLRWWPGLLLWVLEPGSQDLAGMAWVFAEEEIFNHGSNKCIFVRTQLKRLSKEVFQMGGSWEVNRGDVVAQGLWQQGTRQGGEEEGKRTVHAGYSSPVLNLQLCQTIPSLMLGFHIFPVSADSQNVLYILCLLVLSPLSYEIAPRAWGRERRGHRRSRNVCSWFGGISIGQGVGTQKGKFGLFPF